MNLRPALAACLSLCAGACSRPDPFENPDYAAACHGLPLNAEERQKAREDGYMIVARFDCIDKNSWDTVERAKAEVAGMLAKAERETKEAAARTTQSLAEARRGFQTSLGVSASGPPLPEPPARLFVRSDYDSPGVGKLPAWVTPDPRDGEKHAAIVWITGGESNSLGDFWITGTADNDQSASPFRQAGMIMMFPTLRGGNTNSGRKEFFLGEVDDVIAAGRHAASLPYVDRVFLGGHSTGGTLVLLTAETSGFFAGVFAFGPVTDPQGYGPDLLPFDLDAGDPREHELRSPIHWLHGISNPTYIIEGRETPGNISELEALCARNRNSFVKCVPVAGKNHFSVLDAVTKKLAARIVVGGGDDDTALVRPDEFAAAAASASPAP
jgi:acetyl esterase/lipase